MNQDTEADLRSLERRIEAIERDIAWAKDMAAPILANPGKFLAKLLQRMR